METVLASVVAGDNFRLAALDQNGILEFLNRAKPEADMVEKFTDRIEECKIAIEENTEENAEYNGIDDRKLSMRIKKQKGIYLTYVILASILLISTVIFGFVFSLRGGDVGISLAAVFFMLVPGAPIGLFCASAVCGSNARKGEKYLTVKTQSESELSALLADMEEFKGTIRYLPFLPRDYRLALAVNTMINIIEKRGVSSWAELSDKYEEQISRWIVEQNTEEAAEYAKMSAVMTETAAVNAASANRGAGIAAAFSALSFFW